MRAEPLSQASSPPHTVTLACCWRGVTRLLHPFRKVKSPSAEINGETTSRNSLRKEKWYKRNPEEMGIESPSILKQKLQQTNNSSKPPQANSMLALWPRTDTKPRTDNVLAILPLFQLSRSNFYWFNLQACIQFFLFIRSQTSKRLNHSRFCTTCIKTTSADFVRLICCEGKILRQETQNTATKWGVEHSSSLEQKSEHAIF
jgi:hypothetical protein